jgi:hypothetical protein
MFQNYLKIAVRVFRKNNGYLVINLLGRLCTYMLYLILYHVSITITGQALIKSYTYRKYLSLKQRQNS